MTTEAVEVLLLTDISPPDCFGLRKSWPWEGFLRYHDFTSFSILLEYRRQESLIRSTHIELVFSSSLWAFPKAFHLFFATVDMFCFCSVSKSISGSGCMPWRSNIGLWDSLRCNMQLPNKRGGGLFSLSAGVAWLSQFYATVAVYQRIKYLNSGLCPR